MHPICQDIFPGLWRVPRSCCTQAQGRLKILDKTVRVSARGLSGAAPDMTNEHWIILYDGLGRAAEKQKFNVSQMKVVNHRINMEGMAGPFYVLEIRTEA